MSGMDTRSMSRLMGITSLNDPGTHQDWCAPVAIRMPQYAHFAMFVMLYLEKKIPQPPPESCYINRIGIKWLFWLKKRHGPPQKVATQARRKRVLGVY